MNSEHQTPHPDPHQEDFKIRKDTLKYCIPKRGANTEPSQWEQQ